MRVLKKILNILIIVIGVVFIAFCVDLVLNKAVNTSNDKLSEDDQAAVQQISNIVALLDERGDTIWDSGSDLADNAYVVYKSHGFLKGSVYVINADLSGNIFAQEITASDNSTVKVYRLSYAAPQTLKLLFAAEEETTVTIGGTDMYAVRYTSDTISDYGTGSLEETFCKGIFERYIMPLEEIADESAALTAEDAALIGLEYEVIDDMLSCESVTELNEYIAYYVTLRCDRTETGDTAQLAEEQQETQYGSAQYFWYAISQQLGHNYTYFNRVIPDDINFYSAYYYVFSDGYSGDVETYFSQTSRTNTGAALCEVLSKNIVASWGSRLGQKSGDDSCVSQFDLLCEYCDAYCQSYTGITVEELKEKYGYKNLLDISGSLS